MAPVALPACLSGGLAHARALVVVAAAGPELPHVNQNVAMATEFKLYIIQEVSTRLAAPVLHCSAWGWIPFKVRLHLRGRVKNGSACACEALSAAGR